MPTITFITPDDWATITPEQAGTMLTDLDAALTYAYSARQRLDAIASAPAKAEQAAIDWAQAVGRQDSAPWSQPLGAFDAYGVGAKVKHGGRLWSSLVPANVWEPTEAVPTLWEDLGPAEAAPDPEPPAAAPEWVTDHDYKVGDVVTFEGRRYGVIQAHRSQAGWTPVVVPALWKLL